MTALRIFLSGLIFATILQTTQARIIIVYPGNDLNKILNNTKGGDTVLIKSGIYKNVILTDKRYSEVDPLVVRPYDLKTVYISGSTITKGCSLEIINCSYVVIGTIDSFLDYPTDR